MGISIKGNDPKVLFVGVGRTIVGWYRAALPALYLKHDWVGIADGCEVVNGLWTHTGHPKDYDIVVWQQPSTNAHRDMIRKIRANGTKVLVEVDDYLHGVRRMKDHDFKNKKTFTKKQLAEFERSLSMTDGLICSTEFLKGKYGRFSPRSWVCKNGLDMGRYERNTPPHDMVNIGWAGATGHVMSFDNLRGVVSEKLERYDNTTFISIGAPMAQGWVHHLGNRVMELPFASLESYPNAWSMFDISLAPARDTGWYRGKSCLRVYEAAALGVPSIASPVVYEEAIEHGRTGFLAESPQEWSDCLDILINDRDLRKSMGQAAREQAREEWDMKYRCAQWEQVIQEVAQS